MKIRKMPTVVMDIECYRNYFLVMFKSVDTGVIRAYEIYDDVTLNRGEIKAIMRTRRVVTFNGNNYDIPMLLLALKGATNATLKSASDAIIGQKMRGWQAMQAFDVHMPATWNHVDLIEVAPGQGSLKLYGGRLHSQRLQELPIDVSALITPKQREELRRYCANDLQTTQDLLNHLGPQLALREVMTEQYGQDLRSKSDAQIAEAVIRSKCAEIMGTTPQKPNFPPGTSFQYTPPDFVRFESDNLRAMLYDVLHATFTVGEKGSVELPPTLENRAVTIGGGVYRMGIGGLHSSEKSQAVWVDDENFGLCEIDVTGYYPAIIIRCGLSPKHLAEKDAFPKVFGSIVRTRVKAKHTGDKTTANTLKIVVNGGFGKLGSKYSMLYSPHLLIQVTLTGQLCLLMLIEQLAKAGFTVVSANTDGIAVKYRKADREKMLSIVNDWETRTGFTMEETAYRGMYSRDVNNYIAVKPDGSVKGKGAFAEISISKNPVNEICTDAVVAYLKDGTPLFDTISQCRDIRKFVTVRTVQGGAVQILDTAYNDEMTPGEMRDHIMSRGWYLAQPGPLTPTVKNGVVREALFTHILFSENPIPVQTAYRLACGEDTLRYVGKVVRFYIGVNTRSSLYYLKKNKLGNRNKVPDSDGSIPLMELPLTFPTDVDLLHYLRIAEDILASVGLPVPAREVRQNTAFSNQSERYLRQA